MPRDPNPAPTVEELITGGIPVPADAPEAAPGGPSADAALAALASQNGSVSSYDLDQLYSEQLQKVLGIGIGYSSTGELYPGFTKPIQIPTGRDWVSAYYADPEMWNTALKLSGWYRGKDHPKLGLKSESYLTSFADLLTQAALSKRSITQLLKGTPQQYAELVKSGKINMDVLMKRARGSGTGRAPLKIEVSAPEDLKEVARQTALDTIGYVPDDAFLGDFVKLYQGMQSGYQRKAYSAAASGGKVTQPGAAQTVAQQELREQYKTQASSYSTVKAFDQFLQIIGGGPGVAGGQ